MEGNISDISGLVKSEIGAEIPATNKIELPKPTFIKKSPSPSLKSNTVALPETTVKHEIDYSETIMNKRDARPIKRYD